MKAIIFLILFMMVSNLNAQIAEDKKKHFVAGATISGLTYSLAKEKLGDPNKALLCSIGAGILAGIAKETLDSTQPGNNFDKKDLLATALGSISISLTINLFDKKIKTKK